MTMLAQSLLERGKKVAGVDVADVYMTDKVLREAKIPVRIGFDATKIPQGAAIIYSSAYTVDNNVEVAWIKKYPQLYKKLPVINYAQAIGALFSTCHGIAVCGSHGKTTVSAWLGFVLREVGLDPSVLVGARVPQFKGSAILGKSKYFVAEADEYQNKLQYFQPAGIVLNNIDFDHPDYFKTKASYYQVFADFVSKLKKSGFLVANVNDAQIRKLLPLVKGQVVTYALADKVTSKIDCVNLLGHSIRHADGCQYFQVNDLGEFKIKLLGQHNIENALAVLSAGLAMGLNPVDLKKSLAGFKGTARRAESEPSIRSRRSARIFRRSCAPSTAGRSS